MILKKRQLLLATLVIALGAAIFINRYYTAPQVDSAASGEVKEQQTSKSTDKGANLGDARYVISTDVVLDDAAAQAVASEYIGLTEKPGKYSAWKEKAGSGAEALRKP